jgi:plasmid stabilization system protein ParE
MVSSGDSFEPLILPRAQADLESIVRYISERSLQGAKAWRERWDEVLAELRKSPLSAALAPESASYGSDIRQLLFKTRRGRTYRVLFTVVGRGVFILTVRGPGQDLIRRGLFRRP